MIQKYHLEPVTFMEQIRSTVTTSLSKMGSPLHGTEAKLTAYGKGFKITWPNGDGRFRDKRFDLGKRLKRVGIRAYGYDILFSDLFITSHHTDKDLGVAISATGGYLHSAGFRESSPYYFQVLIPSQKKMDAYHTIASYSFDSDLGYRSSDGVLANFARDELQACFIHKEGRSYIAIDSPNRQSYQEFSDKVHAFKNALGYVTGYLAADNGCFFAYTHKTKEKPVHFHYTEWRSSIISSYLPLYANPYGFVRDRRLAERLYRKKVLRPMTTAEFSRLCQRLHDSTVFTGVVILMLEASVASLLFMPGGFAIALETLAGLIIEPGKDKLAPMKTPALSKRVRKGCSEVIQRECEGLPEEDLKVLLGRIQHLNEVTNKSRLRQPFEQLGVLLSATDLYILSTRNDFLHGRTPDVTGAGEHRTEKRAGLDLYYVSMRFYTLLNRLILKWVGYENYVLNHAKIQENTTLIKLKEPYHLKD